MTRQPHEPPEFYIHQSGDPPNDTLCGGVKDPREDHVPGSPTVTCWICLAILYELVDRREVERWRKDKLDPGDRILNV